MIDWDDLAARNAPLNAFVDFDRAAAGGGGPLADMAIGVKSNIAVAGLPWTAGMELRRDVIATRDADVVARLRAAGAAILGTLNMHEAALGATTDNPWFGRTMNPRRDGHTPGGSSGGSAAAVAGGLCDAALGTDTLGSIRIPAAYCGIYGLKPTHGAVPDDGLVPLHRGFDAIGPLARSLTVLEAVWDVLSSPHRSVTPAKAGVHRPANSEAKALAARWMPGRVRHDEKVRCLTLQNLGGVACEPGVLAGYERAIDSVFVTDSLNLPPLKTIRTAGFVEAALELTTQLGADRHLGRLSPELRWLLDFAEGASRDLPLLAETRATLIAAIGTDGVLLLPTTPQAAFPHGRRAPVDQADFTCLANIAGLPALALPAGHDAVGLPVGIQLVGPAGGEAMLFAAARALDASLAPCALPEE